MNNKSQLQPKMAFMRGGGLQVFKYISILYMYWVYANKYCRSEVKNQSPRILTSSSEGE